MLVVPLVVEVTFEGNYGDRNWANVQHLVWDESTAGRDLAGLDEIALAVEGAFVNNLLTEMVEQVSLTNVKVADLNSELGLITNLPGASTGDVALPGMAPNVAVLATKVDGHSRSQRPGRMFLVGAPEAQTDTASPGRLNATGIAAWQAVLSGYLGDLTTTAGGSDVYPVVLHKSTAPGGFTAYLETGLAVNALLATQRRRLRG